MASSTMDQVGARSSEDRLRVPAAAPTVPVWIVVGVLVLLTCTPSAVRYVLATSSLIQGLIVAVVAILGLALFVRMPRQPGATVTVSVGLVGLLGLGIVAHLVVARLMLGADLARAAGSLVALLLCALSVLAVQRLIFDPVHSPIRPALNLMLWLFLVIGIGGVVGIQPVSSVTFGRPAFPFSEPSHLAFTIAPFVIEAAVRSNQVRRLLLLAAVFTLAYLLQSLSLIIATTLAAIVCLPAWQAIGIALGSTVAINYLDLDYFTDRLDLTYQSQNLSSLVYVQGWEAIIESLKKSMGWGLGFQQMGITQVYLPTSDLIRAIMREDLNLTDGSFVLSKLVSEFGLFGLAAGVAFAACVVVNIIRLRKHAVYGAPLPDTIVFASSVVVGYAVEMYVRGAGYFSGSLILVLAALLAIRSFKRRAQ